MTPEEFNRLDRTDKEAFLPEIWRALEGIIDWSKMTDPDMHNHVCVDPSGDVIVSDMYFRSDVEMTDVKERIAVVIDRAAVMGVDS